MAKRKEQLERAVIDAAIHETAAESHLSGATEHNWSDLQGELERARNYRRETVARLREFLRDLPQNRIRLTHEAPA